MNRCSWVNTNNELYIKYHDEEWGILNLNEQYLFEMLILESFQAGLSWECVLNKREAFRKAFDNFDITTTVTSVIATLSNIGPGLEIVGPAGNFSVFSDLSKLVLSFCMLAGRLEIYPMLILFSPSLWKKNF